MILVDANVWVYFLDADLDEHPKVRAWLPRALTEEDALIPALVQVEVLHYLARQLGDDAASTFEAFLAHPGEIEPLTGSVVAEASRLLLAHRGQGIGGRDAALLVTAKRAQASIATADKALAKVARKIGVKSVDPTR